MRLVPVLISIYSWQKNEIEKINMNLSENIRDYLNERLNKTICIELKNIEIEINKIKNQLSVKESLYNELKHSMEAKKEIERNKFIDDNIDAFVLKKYLMDGNIPDNTPIFDFPDRNKFINDVKNNIINKNSKIEEFKKYKFKIKINKIYPEARMNFRKEFEKFINDNL